MAQINQAVNREVARKIMLDESIKRKIEQHITNSAIKTINNAMDDVIKEAKTRAPGHIKDMFYKKFDRAILVFEVGNRHEASFYVEYGTGPRGDLGFHKFGDEDRPSFTTPFIEAKHIPRNKRWKKGFLVFEKTQEGYKSPEGHIPDNIAFEFEKGGKKYMATQRTRGQFPQPYLRPPFFKITRELSTRMATDLAKTST